MPLYSCQRCGWATASAWREAVQGHREGCPECTGAVELVPLGGRSQENIVAVGRVGRPFEMRECTDPDGALRLAVHGGLDVVVADRLTSRLQALRVAGRPIRIDLSELEFIDCTGMEALMDELTSARRRGQRIEIDRPVSAPVKRAITFMDVASVLWPPEYETVRSMLRVVEGAVEPPPVDRPDALRDPEKAGEVHHLGLVVGDSVEPGPRPPETNAPPDG